jgi:hypothetical protein
LECADLAALWPQRRRVAALQGVEWFLKPRVGDT